MSTLSTIRVVKFNVISAQEHRV